MMDTRVAEVGPGVYQLTTYLSEIDFSVNQYLVAGEAPLLWHTGMRGLFPQVASGVEGIVPLESLRWIAFGHVEADECGSMNNWLGAAPRATVVQGQVGCMVSVSDLADRPPRPLADGEVLDNGWAPAALDRHAPRSPRLGGGAALRRRGEGPFLRGDLFSRMGPYRPTTEADIVGPAVAAEDAFPSMSLHPEVGAILRRLADLEPAALALMHGPVFIGDCRSALLSLAEDIDGRVAHAAHNPDR